MIRHSFALAALAASIACQSTPTPEVVLPHDTFTLESKALHEMRTINVYLPSGYNGIVPNSYPVLYMPDGGIAEDFPHVSNTVDALIREGVIREHLVVGIENTQRRRDMTGPTEVASDREIAPVVGGSADFRAFLRDELIPEIERRYRVTNERAIIGESAAGLFIVETYLLEPQLFSTWIAMDPSLWWNAKDLLKRAPELIRAHSAHTGIFYLTAASTPEISVDTPAFAAILEREAPRMRVLFVPRPDERHDTIYRASERDALTRCLAK